ncbi:hypothetical protein B0H19DRAFT_892285, partial [Mycena capillaripes]
NSPEAYLFVCPPENFRTGLTSFKWPNCPSYWSLNPFGAVPLSAEEATCLGFPCITLTTDVSTKSWDESVCTGLRKFHQAKGFDPDSQDLAWDLGHPLYHL